MAENLENIVEKENTVVNQGRGKHSFVHRYIARPLRFLAGISYLGGAASLVSGIGAPATFGFTGIGAGISALADLADSYAYAAAGNMKGRYHVPIWGEGLLEKAIGYIPFGGVIDLYRGHEKFKNWENYSLRGKESELAEKTESEPRIIKLEDIRDKRYSQQKKKAA